LDVKKRFTEEQIIGFLREAEAGLAVAELCRRHGFSDVSYYLWRSKFGGMSASALRYEPAADRNCALKEKIIALAQRHRRYGSGMIYLKLRQAGEIVNHKRVDRLYAEAGLQVKKRRRKKIPLSDRHSLERPTAANQVWSMDFVFDRTA
jgi:transposase-like protein